MPEMHPIAALEIVGYANRLAPSMYPAVVPPVFRVRGSERILLPAFVIRGGFVCDATEREVGDLTALNEACEITLFAAPRDARPDFELWIDEEGHDHYEPIPQASATLRRIAEGRIALALDAFRSGDHTAAKEHCRVAICADDRLIDPLAIRAAIARREKDRGKERLMEKLASGRVSPSGFRVFVEGYLAEIPEGLVPLSAPQNVAPGLHPIMGMAALKAAVAHA